MSVENIIRNLRVLLRAERLIAEIRLHHLLARSGLQAVAALIALFGLAMLNAAGYFAAVPLWGPIGAAALVAAVDFALALALLLLAARLRPSRELALAREIHETAMETIIRDARTLEGAVRHPLDSLLPGLIAPLANLLLKTLKRADKPPA